MHTSIIRYADNIRDWTTSACPFENINLSDPESVFASDREPEARVVYQAVCGASAGNYDNAALCWHRVGF